MSEALSVPAKRSEDATTSIMCIRSIVKLLWVYQGILAIRPIEKGNTKFLHYVLECSLTLGKMLSEAPRSNHMPRSEIVKLVQIIEGQTELNAREMASESIRILGPIKERFLAFDEGRLIGLRGVLPAINDDYEEITVFFGPALGLGDQITFLQVLYPLMRCCTSASLTIYTLYPGMWPRFFPNCREICYRETPLAPFIELDLPSSGQGRELVIATDFEDFQVGQDLIKLRKGRDILEMALGRRLARFMAFGVSWKWYEIFQSAVAKNNYDLMAAIARKLFPEDKAIAAWLPPLEEPQKKPLSAVLDADRQVLRILINPFTSKRLVLNSKQWVRFIRGGLSGLDRKCHVELLIFPGLDAWARLFANEIVDRFNSNSRLCSARLLDEGREPINHNTALSTLIAATDQIDMCVTIDTFTAHLIPLFRVPSLVLTYGDNREYWVPSRWSFHCYLDDVQASGVSLFSGMASRLMVSKRNPGGGDKVRSRRLLDATQNMHREDLFEEAAADLAGLLTSLKSLCGRNVALADEAQHWLTFWSRVAHGLDVHPLSQEALRYHVADWGNSDVFKFLTLELA